MPLARQVMAYCERTGPGFWDEPANALSNLAFLGAAMLLARRVPGAALPRTARALPPALVAVAVASFTFHTRATAWAGLADAAAILVLCSLYLWTFLRHAAGAGRVVAAAACVLHAAASAGLSAVLPAGPLNGSAAYLPNLLVLPALALWAGRHSALQRHLLGASAVFAVSLALRTVDRALCPHWPAGTHWAWHLLNAWCLWLAIGALQQRLAGPPAIASGAAAAQAVAGPPAQPVEGS